jgi:GT2 family glycosyltransferase
MPNECSTRLVRARGRSCSAASQFVIDLVYDCFNDDADDARFFTSNNIAVDAALFDAIGGFNVAFGRAAAEDRELCDRWRHTGRRLTYVPRAIIDHFHDLNLRSYCRQHFGYGRGARHYHRVRAARGSGSMVEDMRFHRHLLRLIRRNIDRLPRGRRAPVVALVFVGQLVTAAGYFYELARSVAGRYGPGGRTTQGARGGRGRRGGRGGRGRSR